MSSYSFRGLPLSGYISCAIPVLYSSSLLLDGTIFYSISGSHDPTVVFALTYLLHYKVDYLTRHYVLCITSLWNRHSIRPQIVLLIMDLWAGKTFNIQNNYLFLCVFTVGTSSKECVPLWTYFLPPWSFYSCAHCASLKYTRVMTH